MMKFEKINLFKKIMFLLLFSIGLLGIGYLAALLISHFLNFNMQDTLGYEGLILIFIGVFLLIKSHPSSSNVQGTDASNLHYVSPIAKDVTAIEKDSATYSKEQFVQSAVEFSFTSLTLILGGSFIIIVSFIK